jgi:iduronate 2-sulfatase
MSQRIVPILILACLFAVAPSAAQEQPQPKKKLNVLLVMSDDLGWSIGTYGNEIAHTPNLDRLAARGVRFDRAYNQYPLCGPSRASFMTGMRPNNIGVLDNATRVRDKHRDVVTLSQLFMNNGYYAARTGKIYHQGIPGGVGGPGLDDPQSWHHTHNPPGAEFSTPGEEHDPQPEFGQSFRRVLGDGEGVEQADYQAADEAIRILREKRDQPFFLAVGFIRPHVPVIAPRKYFDLYDMSRIQLPEVPANDLDDIPSPAIYRPKNWGMSEEDCRESVRAYYASTSFMDAQLGRVLDELDQLGLTDSTLIVFASDHGYMLGEHFAWQKMMLFEPVSRTPLIVAGPGVARGTPARGLVELIDIYPTVVEMAGLKAPANVDGESIVRLLKDPSQRGKPAAFTQLDRGRREGRTIRTERWRYIEWNRGAAEELYDHDSDPDEHTNLAADPAHAHTLSQLREQLHAVLPPPATANTE